MGKTLTDEEAAALGLPADAEPGAIYEADQQEAQPPAPAANMPAGYAKTVAAGSPEAIEADENTARRARESDHRAKYDTLEKVAAAAQTGSMELGDELAGLKSWLQGMGYREGQKKAEATLNEAQRRHPGASLAGVAPMMLVPGGQTVAGRLALAGLVGGATAAGEAKGGESISEVATDAGKGGLQGLAIQGGLEVASPILGKFAKLLRGKAEDLATKGVGNRGGISERMGKLGYESPDEVRALGRDVLDQGLLDSGLRPWGPGKQEVLSRAEALKSQAGQSQRAAIMKADLSGKPADYDEALWALAEPVLKAPPMTRAKAAGPVRDFGEALLEQATETPGSYAGLQRIKSDLMGNVDWQANVPKAKALARQSVGSMGGKLTEQVGRAAGPEAATQLKEANRLYGVGADVAELAADTGKREAANRTLGQAEQLGLLGGGMGAGAGGLASLLGISGPEAMAVGAAGGAALQNFLRLRGPATFAPALDRTAKVAAGAAGGLPGIGPALTQTVDEEDRNRILAYLKSLGAE